MRRNKSKRARLTAILLILVLLISVGYAALSTNLGINGTATLKKPTLNIYFTNVQVKQGSVCGTKVVTAPSVPNNSTDTTTLTWEVSMDTPGEFYEFNVDVVNGTSTDAMINTATDNIITSSLTTAQQKYLDYTIKYVNGAAVERYDKLAAGETKTLTVKLLFKQDVNPGDLPASGQTGISLSYSTNYVQADSNAVTKVTTLAPAVSIGDNVTFSTSLNGVTLNKWKVLDIEEVGGVSYTYLILDGKLSSSAVEGTSDGKISPLEQGYDSSDEYNIGTAMGDLEQAKDTFVSSMNNTTYWQPLVTHGVLNGNSIASSSAYAIGSPTLQMFVNSWNKTYTSNTIDVREGSSHTDYATWTGYQMKYTSSSSWDSSIDLSTTNNAASNTLYFPKDSENEPICYWLATECDDDDVQCAMCIDSYNDNHNPGITSDYMTESNRVVTLRPVVCIPTSLFN